MTQEERTLAHLEKIREDVRDEIKKRIEQRDKYSIQMTIALGAIVTISFSTPDLRAVLIALPLVSIYFTVLIMYSYEIHHVVAKYLREKVEPELARICSIDKTFEWETFYCGENVPGIRRRFFLFTLWGAYILPVVYLWIAHTQHLNTAILITATVLYGLAALWITLWQLRDMKWFPRKISRLFF